jgi:Amt family ammonium transporter
MNLIFCLLCILLSPLAAAGLALIHQGLGRSRSAAQAMLATLCALAIAAIVTVCVGASWIGFAGGAAHVFQVAGAPWNWLGDEAPALRGISAGPVGAIGPLALCLQVFAAGLACIIPLSAGTDRWRLAPICLATAVFSGILYPLYAHWIWGGGWLSQLAVNFGLGPFQDVGGASVIQVTGGLMALSVAWILGPRRGKYSDDGMATAIPGHNIVLVLFGCLIALVGWIGLDCAASILFYGISPDAHPEQIVAVIVNAVLSASAGCLAAVVTTQIRYRKPDASLSANGWIAGLVAGSAACSFVSPLAAIFIAAVAGSLTTYLVEIFELRLLVDDPGGAISVHAGAGLWGLIAFGVFSNQANPSGGTIGSHILAQLVGVATLLGFMLPLIHGCNLLLNRFLTYRVDRDGDWQGMDIRELGAGAYPEFVIHADEFIPR